MGLYIKIEFHVFIHRDGGRKKEERPRTIDGDKSPEQFCRQAEKETVRQKCLLSRSTVNNYQTAIRSFKMFLEGLDNKKARLDDTLLKHYERWLHDRLLKPNTVSCYMRSLRSLLSKIYGEDTRRMFGNVYTGLAATEKRSLSISDITRLKSVGLLPGSFLSLVRDLFLFSFYALGMPFVDMAFLRRQQIRDGQLTYYRHKTGQQVTVKIEPCMQEIIDRYQVEGRDYVFPLLKSEEPGKAYDEYLLMLNRYNRSLKRLAAKAQVGKRLTSYVARHTWASTAFSENVDLPVISKALGHANPQNTLIYIRQIDDRRLNDANRRLIDTVCKGTQVAAT